MDGFRSDLAWVFPNWQTGVIAFGWVGLSTLVSAILNTQDARNKRLNMVKVLLLTTFLVTWTLGNNYYSLRPFNWRAIIVGYTGAALFMIGDWLAYFLHVLRFAPGGTRGWFWRLVLRGSGRAQTFLNRMTERAQEVARSQIAASLREPERAMLRRIQNIEEAGRGEEKSPPARLTNGPAESSGH